jgi:hypothetical protein
MIGSRPAWGAGNGRRAPERVPDDLEALEETLDLLAAPGVLDEITAARREIDDGAYLTVEGLRARFLDR